MDEYTLTYSADEIGTEANVTFFAHSTANALTLAREAASGDWAVLSSRGKTVCRMRLVEDSGVWLIEPLREANMSQFAPAECAGRSGMAAP